MKNPGEGCEYWGVNCRDTVATNLPMIPPVPTFARHDPDTHFDAIPTFFRESESGGIEYTPWMKMCWQSLE